tara:strand:+ start:1165 stop:1596 length:432 start_codon:yes stop_codon:yes gene_type:complete
VILTNRRALMLSKRKYGTKTNRKPRLTNTDRLNNCDTWQEIVDSPLYDDWIKTVYTPQKWLESFPDQSYVEKQESRKRYESLCDVIDEALTPWENTIFYGIAEEEKSLRVLAAEYRCSYEKIRQTFEGARVKLKERYGKVEEN